jgi:hypothetical protein
MPLYEVEGEKGSQRRIETEEKNFNTRNHKRPNLTSSQTQRWLFLRKESLRLLITQEIATAFRLRNDRLWLVFYKASLKHLWILHRRENIGTQLPNWHISNENLNCVNAYKQSI